MSAIHYCEKCGKEFSEDYRKDPSSRKKPMRFCSRSCANSRTVSDARKEKLSAKMKGYHFGAAKKGCVASNRATLENGKLKEGTCPVCGKVFTFHSHTPKKYCSRTCWDKVSGGLREGSVKNYQSGNYLGYYYDSSWELIWIQWALSKGVKFERNKKGFPYIYKGKQHLYYPDFYLPEEDKYVEIKGIVDDLWEAKKSAFPFKLDVITKNEIKLYM